MPGVRWLVASGRSQFGESSRADQRGPARIQRHRQREIGTGEGVSGSGILRRHLSLRQPRQRDPERRERMAGSVGQEGRENLPSVRTSLELTHTDYERISAHRRVQTQGIERQADDHPVRVTYNWNRALFLHLQQALLLSQPLPHRP